MRIGMILDSTFPPDPRVEKEALSLLQEGHEVYLFSLDIAQRSGTELYKGIQVVRYPMSNLLYKLSALAYTFPFYRWGVSDLLTHFIKTNAVEVLHVHDMVIAESVFHVNKAFNLPVVLDYHENRPEIMKQYKHVNTFSGRVLINLKQWAAKYYELAAIAQRVVVVTEAAKSDIIAKTKKELNSVIVLPNTVSYDEFLNQPIQSGIVERMQNSFNLLYIGDTSIRRGVDTAIEAVAMIREKIPNVKLWLIGKSSADDELRTLTKRLSLSDQVQFEGWQDPSTFPSYLQNTHAALSPLKRNEHHDTTYANKLFQYMACGKPVIVSDCVAQADLVKEEHCGLVHRADDARDLADKILSIYTNQHEARLMGERGKEAVLKKWNWNLTVKQLIEMYRSGFKR